MKPHVSPCDRSWAEMADRFADLSQRYSLSNNNNNNNNNDNNLLFIRRKTAFKYDLMRTNKQNYIKLYVKFPKKTLEI